MRRCGDKMTILLFTALAVIAAPTDGRLMEKTPATTTQPHVESVKLVQGLKDPPAHFTTVPTTITTTVVTSTATQRSKRSDSEQEHALTANKIRNLGDNTLSSKLQETPAKGKDNVLVKKPIPKFNEVDYDDDFQVKLFKSKTRPLNSNEKEDDDFNLDDYEFDVNHDEFAGKMKPRDPVLKAKFKIPDAEGDTEIIEVTKKPTTGKIKRGVHGKNKVAIADENLEKKKVDDIQDDYYDDKPKQLS